METDERRLVEHLSTWPPEQRRALLNVLTDDPETRAAKIGELFQADGGPVAELLVDIEADPAVRVTVIGMLRAVG